MKIAVLGAGAWGTAIAMCWADRHAVTLWARDREQAQTLADTRRNERYLPGFVFPESLRVVADRDDAVCDAELVVIATPVAGLRDVLGHLAPAQVPVMWLCKGFERPAAKLPHEVFAEICGDTRAGAVLSGPSFAQEIAAGLPCALTLASTAAGLARELARQLHAPPLRMYSHDDVAGVEVGGAMKNVMAIAVGVCDGMGLGMNARAALMTRGLAEMTRVGIVLGARADTFSGLSGLGDLILTCTGDLSRNRRVGLSLAAGKTLADAQRELGHVAEGVYTAHEILNRAVRLGVDVPITRAVCAVLENPADRQKIVQSLLARDSRSETG